MTEKVLCTGKTHNTAGREGGARSGDGKIDLKLPHPHPAAEELFGAAWSACYMGALERAASQRNIKFAQPPSVDAEVDLLERDDGFSLRARLKVTLPGVERKVAEELAEAAHGICPYSKATHGRIETTTTVA
jgi:Ohr subfamily peroxiredoxin